jgi:hypothetical protein
VGLWKMIECPQEEYSLNCIGSAWCTVAEDFVKKKMNIWPAV